MGRAAVLPLLSWSLQMKLEVKSWMFIFITTGLVVLAALTCFLSASAQPLWADSGPMEKITVSTTADAKSALLFIAQHNGYFSKNGLEVTLKTFPSGKLGCDQLKAGNIDVANAADFVLVSEIFAGTKSLRCLGSIAAADDHQVIARKDRGILTPVELRGKRIGVPLGTSAEFFLGMFLPFYDLALKDVELINIKPPDLEDALAAGRVDAVAVWEQWIYQIKKRLGDKVISWPAQGGHKYYWLLLSTDALVKTRPDALKRLFKALHEAENFLKSHREEGIEIIAKHINLDPAIVKAAWMKSTYALSFDQALFITMEDEARWMIRNKLTDQSSVPNYLDYIDAKALAEINSQAVRIILPKNRK
jgi:NitT/TauT family transport system substrate-binding protein